MNHQDAAAAATRARKPAAAKEITPETIRRLEREIVPHGEKKSKKKDFLDPEQAFDMLGGLAKMAKKLDKKGIKALSEETGLSKSFLKYLGKAGPKEVKTMAEEFKKHKRLANIQAFASIMESRGLEISLKKGKSKLTDKLIAELDDEKSGDSWSWTTWLAIAGGAVVVGIAAHEGYKYATGGTGLFGSYGGGLNEMSGPQGMTFDQPAMAVMTGR